MKLTFLIALLIPAAAIAQPEIPVEEWTGKTILLIGAHPDDDTYSHGTLSLLGRNGNEIHVLLLTSGNVGTKDTTLTRTELASQFTSAWEKYTPNIPESERTALMERLRSRVAMKDGKPVETFRYYKGMPDGMGR